MLTRFVSLVIIAHLAIGRFTPNERQWSPDDARQNCTRKCEESCICTVPTTCNDNEIKCGEAPPEEHPDCPPDDICVPADCACKLDSITRSFIFQLLMEVSCIYFVV